MERIRDLLADPDRTVRSTDKERAAAREIRDLLKDVIDYRKEAGEDIGEVKNYFPRVVDSLAVANEPGKFKAAAEKLYRDLGVDDPAQAAEAWMTRILDTHAGSTAAKSSVVVRQALELEEPRVRPCCRPAAARLHAEGPAARPVRLHHRLRSPC
jgi:hypothetical protein